MAVSTTTASISYAGNGSTTAFATGFYFLSNSHLVVILKVNSTGVETTKTITTHYTVANAGNPAGGTVTMITAPATGETLTINRVVPQTQSSNYINDDNFNVENIEQDFDKVVMMIQDLQRKIDLCPKYRTTDVSPTVDLGSVVDRALKYFAFDVDGNYTLADPAALVASAAASAAAASASASSASSSASSSAASAAAAAASAGSTTYEGARGYRTQAMAGTITLTVLTDYVNQEFTGTVSSGTVIACSTTGAVLGQTFHLQFVGMIIASGGSVVVKSGSTTLITYSTLGTYDGPIKCVFDGTAWVARPHGVQIT